MFLSAGDTISGQEGRAYATIKGKVEEMFYVKTLEGVVEKNKTDVKTLGKRGTQHKANGWTGTGDMTIYYVTSLFRQLMLDYIKTGKDTYFDITIVNEDEGSSIGKQTVILRGVNLDSVIMAKVDTESEVLEEETSFTFEDVDMPDQFVAPTLGQ
ncbi:phage portal protein [Paenibacillus macquariensis subsp. defensor]|uniref:Phage portal protein n=1 Tax=Paenibacillus antarcticus TaxID=253703 RepID=A0A168P9T0_9BACL|nr:phage tail tube protein [Paenibacillus antarcticus]OAB26193.1 phage portal protein [Paenibacillus macquariensis subsp. defensor]OAB46543.1 phage portal protein [Paenibacillus antarcticus]